MLVLCLVIFSLCLSFSRQDLLYELALKQGLNFTEAESILEYERHGTKRQAPFRYKSGIPQSRICGINGRSLNRIRRQNTVEDERPQGSEDWPWMALLVSKSDGPGYGDWFCGGSLLNSRYVLTAAHCFYSKGARSKDESDFYVRLGEYDTGDYAETETQEFDVDKLIVHPEYDPAVNINDIAILKLNQTVQYTQYVRPICLPGAEPRVNEDTIVAGWGLTAYQGSKSHLLLYVDLPVRDLNECRDALFDSPVHDSNICAGPETGGKDSCNADSGGPLMYQGNGKRWESVGIVSWGRRCGEAYPGVYTSVVKFLKFIGDIITHASA
ncbi:venom protease-like [Planococcus citri]|uniref:venom protease-like n=1 Tax=Planococcus citri TaxID=170843 RepID=UPI0031F90493